MRSQKRLPSSRPNPTYPRGIRQGNPTKAEGEKGEVEYVRLTLNNERENDPMAFDRLSKRLEGKGKASEKGFTTLREV